MHGARVVTVSHPGQHAGVDADAAVTAVPGCTVVVRTADCAPLVLEGHHSVAVVHAGWRGLVAGVVAEAVAALRAGGDDVRVAHLGPCIRPGCYEFSEPELSVVADQLGPSVRSSTAWGTPALDLPTAVALALQAVGVRDLRDESGCTACDRRWFSHRARAEAERVATVAWLAES